jgi:hypothetical protein
VGRVQYPTLTNLLNFCHKTGSYRSYDKKNLENKKMKGNHKEKDTKREIKRRGGKNKPQTRNRN